MQTRTRKILRDIWARKIRTLLVSVSIFIGVFGVVTLRSAGDLLISQLEKDIQEDRLAMTRATISLPNQVDTLDNAATVQALQARDGVAQVEGRTINPIGWREAGATEFEEGTIIFRAGDFENFFIQPPRLIEGEYPVTTPDSDTIQVAIERRFADGDGYGIGDTLDIRLLREIQAGEAPATVTVEIVGIIYQPYDIGGLDVTDAKFFTTPEDGAFILNSAALTNLLVRYDSFELANADLAAFQEAVANLTPYVIEDAQAENPAENAQIEGVRSQNQILVILAVIALVVSGFLVVNVIAAIVSEQKRQIGAMKSLGASTFDNFYMYSGIAFMYGLIAVIPGVLLGVPSGYFAAQGLAAQSNAVIDDFGVSISGILAGGIIGLAIPVVAAIVPVFLGTRVTILEAMSDQGISGSFGQSRLERMLGALPIPLVLRQTINNAFKNKGRLFLTGLTLTLANAAFMGIFSVFFGLTGLTEQTFSTFGFQIELGLQEGQDIDDVAAVLGTVDGLQAIEPGINIGIAIQDYDSEPVTAGPPGVRAQGFNTTNPDIINLDYIDGTGWQDDALREGVVLSSRIANEMNLGNGDEITITANGNTQTFNIIGVVNFPFDTVWFEWSQLANFAGFLDANGAPLGNRVNIIMSADDPDVDTVADKIDEIETAFLSQGQFVRPVNWVQLNQIILTVVIATGVIFSLAAFLIAAVGGVGLLTTLSISVFERQKEIGVMRSVGATSWAIVTQFLVEGLLVGFISFLLAVPISLALRAGLLALLPFGGTFTFEYPPETLIVGFFGMMTLVSVASFWPSFSAARKTVSDILRYQ